jgi:hypothetical protein
VAAGVAQRRECFVQREQRGGRAAQRLQECPASKPDAPSVFADPLFGFGIGARHVFGQRDRAKFAIRCRIDLDWQGAPKLIGHGSCLRVTQAKLSRVLRCARPAGLHVCPAL